MSEVLTRRQNSRVLQCFRAIGVVVDDAVPLRWYGMGKASFATASLGKAFAVYKCDKLTPVLVSPQLPKRIAALEVLPKKQLTLTACGRQVLVWKRVEQVAVLSGHKGSITQLLVVGSVLFSLDDARTLRIWDLECVRFAQLMPECCCSCD
jgi:U3 small nucleolar RNA-associated protein 21